VVTFYTLRVWPSERDKIHPSLDLYLDNDDLHVSPSLHLCSNSAMTVLDDKQLAEQFRTYCESRIRQKYGRNSKIELQSILAKTPGILRKLAMRSDKDTVKVRERLAA
jgi:hypothetical protein